jgi:hypothetical protein
MVLKTLHRIGLTNLSRSEVEELDGSPALRPQLTAVLGLALIAFVVLAGIVVLGVQSASQGLASVAALERKIPTLESRAAQVKLELQSSRPTRSVDPLIDQYNSAVRELDNLQRSMKALATSGGGLFPGSPKLQEIAQLVERSKALEQTIGEVEAKAKARL